MSASLAPQWIFQALTADGKVASGAKLYSYISGTSTPSPLYADEAMTTPLANPIEFDAGGYGEFWLDNSKVYKLRLEDSDGVLIKEREHIQNAAFAGLTIDDIGDIDTTGATAGDALIKGPGDDWIPGTPAMALDDLTDVQTASQAIGDILVKSADGQWKPGHVTVSESAPVGSPGALDWIWFAVDPL